MPQKTGPVPRRRRRTRGTNSNAPRGNTAPIYKSLTNKMTHKVCGLTDPFCQHARGAKYPDDSSERTLPFSREGRYVLVTDANGDANFLFSPSYEYAPYTYPSVATANVVTSWADFAPMPAFTAVSQYRIVSAGFELESITAPLTASGEVNLRSFATDASALAPVDLLTYNATATQSISLRRLDDCAVVLSHNSAMPQTFYRNADDTAPVATSQNVGLNPVTVAISGAPANSSVAVLRWVVHYELKFLDDSQMAQMATPPPEANLALTAAAKRVTSTLPTFFERGASMVTKYVADKALHALAARLGGPVGASAYALATTVD